MRKTVERTLTVFEWAGILLIVVIILPALVMAAMDQADAALEQQDTLEDLKEQVQSLERLIK